MRAACALLLLGACEAAPPADYGDPTDQNGWTVEGDLHVRIVSPAAATPVATSPVDVVVRAYTAGTPAPLEVWVGPSGGVPVAAQAEGAPGAGQRFTAPASLVHGSNRLDVRVQERNGRRRRVVPLTLVYAGAGPGVQIRRVLVPSSAEGCEAGEVLAAPLTAAPEICVAGVVTLPAGGRVDRVAVGEAAAQAPGTDGRFEARVRLTPGQEQEVRVQAWDTCGRVGEGRVRIVHDATPPRIHVDAPADTTTHTLAPSYTLQGRLEDEHGVATFALESPRQGLTALPVRSPWEVSVHLDPGDNPLALVARDRAGNEARVELRLLRDRVIRLGAPQRSGGKSWIELDRQALADLLDESQQRELELVQVELRPAVLSALDALSAPEQHGVDTGAWGDAEWNAFGLLNLTPDTADLSGTRFAGLADIAEAIGVPTPPVLADLLGVEVDAALISPEQLADVLLDGLIGTHPALGQGPDGPVLGVTLHDALADLSTLADRLGPAGGHPGLVGGETRAELFEPAFRMAILAESGLSRHDGVDASAASKDYLFLPDGDEPIRLDFTDPDAFDVVGLVDRPAVDLIFRARESPRFLTAGTARYEAPVDGLDDFYLGDGEVWATPAWELEHVVADAAFAALHERFAETAFRHSLTLSAGSIEEAAVLDWDHGWLSVRTAAGIGPPPDPGYVWDLVVELAQVRLHDGGLAEGEAHVAFGLAGLPVGLDAAQLVEVLRPNLQAQAARLAAMLVGSTALSPSGCDLYLVPSADAETPLLYFRAPGDAEEAYGYERPGFFADAELTERVSTRGPLAGDGDEEHDKVRAEAGARWFIEDDEGRRYEVRVEAASAAGAEVAVRKLEGT